MAHKYNSAAEYVADVIELSPEQGRRIFDNACRRDLGVSAEEFVQHFKAGTMPSEWPHNHVVMLGVLLPFWERGDA
jgi:hypothetical protein